MNLRRAGKRRSKKRRNDPLENIIEYIKKSYHPLSIILYGSYADGSSGPGSDFDALVISADQVRFHDTSLIDGIQLDVFIYPESYFDGTFDCSEFIQIFDGRIILDTADKGKQLRERVVSQISSRPSKTENELKCSIDWCLKMLGRSKRRDAEGMFRWHWVLVDSLEIFCDVMRQPYFGPKKTLKWMETTHPEAFGLYKAALSDFSEESLAEWILFLKRILS